MNKYLLYMILFFSIVQLSHSQEENGVVALALPVRNSLKFNKYVLNPTFSFVREQHKHITFTGKREWMQFDDAPQTYLFSYSGRFSENSGLGLGLFQQNMGVMSTFGGVINYAYNVVLERESNLTFGINLGAYQSGINTGKVVTNFPDSSLDNVPSNTVITVNPGINYGMAFFDFGVALNNLAAYNFTSSQLIENNPEKSVQAHIMYTGYVNSRGFFDETKFSGLVRSEFKQDQTVLSGLAMFTVPKGFWAQAGYNTLYGFSGGIGLNISAQIAFEYNYEKAMGDLMTFGSSHELTLAYKFKNRNRYSYSGDDDEQALIAPPKKSRPVAARTEPDPRKVRAANVDTAAEAQAKADEAARLRLEQEQAQARAAEEARLRLEQEQAQARAAEEARLRLEQEQAQARAAEEARLKLEQEQAQARAAEEARLKLEQEQARYQEGEAARLRLEQEQAQARAAEAARLRLEQEQAQARAAEEARLKLEQEQAQARAAEEARLKLEQEQAQARAAEEARLKLEQEQAQARAAEEARLKLEQEQAQARAAEEARLKLEQEQAQARAAEEARLKLEQEQAQARAAEEARLKREQDSIAQINLNDVVVQAPGSRVNIAEPVTTLSEDSNIEQHDLLTKLRDIVASREQDLLDLKRENDLSEQGIYLEPKPFKSVSAENAALEALKNNLENVIKAQNAKIRQMEEVYSKNANAYADESIRNTYLNRLNTLKAEQVQAIVAKDNLLATLNNIKEETEIERKRRIKRAVYDNEEDRLAKDRAALNYIKQNTAPSTVTLTQNDFDFGEEQSKNIQILKGVNNVEIGYYVVLAVHSDVAKRDDFLTKAVASGQKNINFFYDVNTSKYFIYYQKFETLEEANNALRASNNEPYNAKKSMVKIEK